MKKPNGTTTTLTGTITHKVMKQGKITTYHK